MNTSTINTSELAKRVSYTDSMMVLYLEDGRELSVPLEGFPKLRNASQEELNNWRFIGHGEGIHWEELDEDISVGNLLK